MIFLASWIQEQWRSGKPAGKTPGVPDGAQVPLGGENHRKTIGKWGIFPSFHTFSIYPLVIFLTVCHGKIHHAIKNGINHLFRLGPSKNHGYVSHNQRAAVISRGWKPSLPRNPALQVCCAASAYRVARQMVYFDVARRFEIGVYHNRILSSYYPVIVDVIIDVISGYIPIHPSYPVIR